MIATKYTDIELREIGITLLVEHLGYAETLRFLSQLSPGQGDYLAWRERLFADATVDELFERAREHFDKSKKER